MPRSSVTQAGRLRFACLPTPATLEDFDYDAASGCRIYVTTAADLAARCHRAAIEGRWAITMRLSAGPTLLDIIGDSYRLRDHHARTQTLRAAARHG